ncbi:MAG: hypothetical protein ACK4KW_00975 [Gemmobacter sp.]
MPILPPVPPSAPPSAFRWSVLSNPASVRARPAGTNRIVPVLAFFAAAALMLALAVMLVGYRADPTPTAGIEPLSIAGDPPVADAEVDPVAMGAEPLPGEDPNPTMAEPLVQD